jgi:hypothetical protein
MTKTNPSKKSGADKQVIRNRRTLPSRQRTYRYLHVRVDRLEDAISHFYNVINELGRRVSTLEKQLPGSRSALAKGAHHPTPPNRIWKAETFAL